SFQRSEIHLSRFRNQPQNRPMARLFVLPPASQHRKKHTRTTLRLSSRQDPHRNLDGQRRFFPTTSICCQYRSLVQAPLSSQRIFPSDPRYHSYRFSGSPSQAHPKGQEKYRETSPRLSLSKRISSSLPENQGATDTSKISFLQMKPEFIPS